MDAEPCMKDIITIIIYYELSIMKIIEFMKVINVCMLEIGCQLPYLKTTHPWVYTDIKHCHSNVPKVVIAHLPTLLVCHFQVVLLTPFSNCDIYIYL